MNSPRLSSKQRRMFVEAQADRVAQITHNHIRLYAQGLDDLLDLVRAAIIANDDLKVFVGLVECALQRCAEEARVERRDGNADKRSRFHTRDSRPAGVNSRESRTS